MPRDSAAEPAPNPIARPFGEFEKRYDESGQRADDSPWEWALEHLGARLDASGSRWLSLDVFDTLLLRNHKSERRRFWEIAELWLAWLGENGCKRPLDTLDLFRARLRAALICYGCGPVVLATQEGRLEDIVRIVLNLVGLPPADADALIRIEIDYEAQNTRPNPLIQALVAEHRAGGGKVVLVSDMYMRGADIARLLAQHAATAELADAIFSSADTVVNKRTGTIFNGIANHLAAAPADFFHVGDNFVADYAMPRSAGWNAQHLPIPRSEELRREEDRRLFEASI